jgi:hypothetical protein
MPQHVGLIMDTILDTWHMSQMMWHNDWPTFAIVNKVEQPRVALPTIMNFWNSHPFLYDDGLCMIWDSKHYCGVRPNVDKREHVMGFLIGIKHVLFYQKPSNIHFLVKSRISTVSHRLLA